MSPEKRNPRKEDRQSWSLSDRAVSSAVGTILLVGIVLVAIGMLLGGSTLTSNDQVNRAAIEDTMSSFASQSRPVVFGEKDRADISIDASSKAFVTKPNQGTISVEVAGSTIYNGPVGVVKASISERSWGYQSGAAWLGMSDDESAAAVDPPLSYTSLGDPTYSFPIVKIDGSSDSQITGTAIVSHSGSAELYSDHLVSSSDTVKIVIESVYYEAWKHALLDDYQLAESQISVDPNNNRVTAEFGNGQKFYLHVDLYRITISDG